jgi:hypothetical protein
LQEEMSGRGDAAPSVVSKAPVKMRQSKSRTVPSGMMPQQLAVYQPMPPQAHQYMVHPDLHFIHSSGCSAWEESNTANIIGSCHDGFVSTMHTMLQASLNIG